MYTLEELQDKTFKKLKEIGYHLNVLPEGDRRCRQNWINALVGTQPPLLKLLETSAGVKVEPVAEAIEVQTTEPVESKFGRIVYPKPSAKPIAQVGEQFNTEEFQQAHPAETERPPNGGDNDRDRLESEQKLSQSAIAPAAKKIPGVDRKISTAHQLLELFKSSARILKPIKVQHQEPIEIPPGVSLSPSFLARYSPPKSENVHYLADADGQLNLLNFEVGSADEPPDPDDFNSIENFNQAIARWDAENPETLTTIDSMTEWAPCPDEWYEPVAEILPLKTPSIREVLELSRAIEAIGTIESWKCWNFSIPTFDVWCDRQNDKDEPPDTGSFARGPKPKPPSFPPRGVVAGDRTNRIKKFARSAILSSGRAPPGGDASF